MILPGSRQSKYDQIRRERHVAHKDVDSGRRYRVDELHLRYKTR